MKSNRDMLSIKGYRRRMKMEMQFNTLLQKLTIHDIQTAMEDEKLTSKELVMYYLHRIAKYDRRRTEN